MSGENMNPNGNPVASTSPTLDHRKSALTTKTSTRSIRAKYKKLKNRTLHKKALSHALLKPNSADASKQKIVKSYVSFGTQTTISYEDKSTQVDAPEVYLPFSFDTSKHLKSLTGIPTLAHLDAFVRLCENIRPEVYSNLEVPVKHKILLTMFKLKQNMSNAVMANLFRISDRDLRLYFADTIKLLSKVLDPCIRWHTKEQNNQSLPACFAEFPNAVTVLDCTDIKTVKFGCRAVIQWHRAQRIVKLLIGSSPAGMINFTRLSKPGKTTPWTKFNLTDLAAKLEPGDAVIVGEDFMAFNELEQAGVQIIGPQIMSPDRRSEEVEHYRLLEAATAHVKTRILMIKSFKILDGVVKRSNMPFLDDIIKVVCAITNLSPPIFEDSDYESYSDGDSESE